jgi:neuroligin
MIQATDHFESLIELISDATIVSPVIKTALVHERVKKKSSTYLFEFSHSSERSHYPSHLGCINGDELSYFFGAPLINGHSLGSFSTTYTKQETSFSEAVMTYFGNFVKTG